MNKIRCIGLALIFLAGHASAEKYEVDEYIPKMTVVKFPDIDSESEVDVGDSMIATALKGIRPGIVLKESIGDVKIRVSFLSYVVKFPSGELPLFGMSKEGKFYNGVNSTVSGIGEIYVGMLFVPDDLSKPKEVCIRSGTFAKCEAVDSLESGTKFEPTSFDIYAAESFKRELVFSGVSQNTITILYREFIKDMARPAFSQELKYDISVDDIIGYKGARFKVIKANNTGIRYKVLKHLN